MFFSKTHSSALSYGLEIGIGTCATGGPCGVLGKQAGSSPIVTSACWGRDSCSPASRTSCNFFVCLMFASLGDIVQCMFTDTLGSLSFVPGGICPCHVRGSAYIESRTSLLSVDGTCAMRTLSKHTHTHTCFRHSSVYFSLYL